MSSEKKTKLFRIRKTVCKMLNARGYLVSQKELDRDKDSFTEEFGDDPRRESLTIMVPKRDDPSENVSEPPTPRERVPFPFRSGGCQRNGRADASRGD